MINRQLAQSKIMMISNNITYQIENISTSMDGSIVKFPLVIALLKFALVSMLFPSACAILEKPRGLYIDRVSIRNANGIPVGYTATLSWSCTLPAVISSALSLENYQIISPHQILSYTAQLKFLNVSNALLQINPMLPNSSVSYLSFTVIIVTDTSAVFELLISQSQINPMTVPPSSFYHVVYVYSLKYTFTPNIFGFLGSKRFMQWFVLSSPAVGSQYLQVENTLVPNTSTIQINIFSNFWNNYYRVKIAILLYCNLYTNNIAFYNLHIRLGDFYPNHVLPVDMAVPANLFGSPYASMCCTIGLTGLAIYMNRGASFFQFTLNGTTINSAAFTSSVRLAVLMTTCFAQCPQGKYLIYPYACLTCSIRNCLSCSSSLCTKCATGYLLPTSINSCIPCAHYILNCYTCSSELICTKCKREYTLAANNYSCFPCNDFIMDCLQCENSSYCTSCMRGFPVLGRCTTIPGCIHQAQTANSALSLCTLCDSSEFDAVPVNGVCICKETGAFIITNHCTAVAGCIATQKVGGIVYCKACNVNDNFFYDSSTQMCLCTEGFYLQSAACVDICGDGKVFSSECDDGNNQNGDGCSSSCLIEVNHRCTSNSSMESSCYYIGKQLNISLTNTKKTKGSNQGVFAFTFQPPMPLLKKYNFSNYFQFSCNDATYHVSSWTYSNNQLMMVVDYQTDLEGRQASILFSFNQLFIRLIPINIPFTVKSNDIMLIIEDTSIKSLVIRYIFLSTSVIAVFLLLFGSWANKMAGVQLVTSLQLVYYLHFTTLYYTPALSSFQQLSIVGLNNLFYQTTQQNYNAYSDFQKITFSMSKTEITIAVISVFLFIIALSVIFFAVFGNILSKNSNLCNKITYLSKQLYSYVLLPACIWLLLPAFLSLTTTSTRLISQPFLYSRTIRTILSMIILVITSLVFAFKLGHLLLGQKDNKDITNTYKTKNYIQIFQVYHIIQVTVLLLWIRGGHYFLCYILLLIQIFMLAICQKFRPYHQALNTVTLTINLSNGIIFLIFLILREKGVLSASQLSDIFCVMLIGIIICFSGLLTILRVVISIIKKIRQCCSQGDKVDDNRKATVDQKLLKDKLQNSVEFDLKRQRKSAYNHLLSYLQKGSDKNRQALNDNSSNQAKDEILQRLTEEMKVQFRKARMERNKQRIIS